MDNITMSLGIYFEVKDAEIYGGEGTVGYAALIVDVSLSGLQKADFTKYAESQKEDMAQFCHVPVEKVRVISRDEYKKTRTNRKEVTNNENGNEGRTDTHKRSRQCPVHNHKELGKDEVEQADADTKRTG